ncbi:YjiH family protein [Anaerobacillus isosaccharinicus]|uniref:YjiH family protein n=1 Tax=Anaerobacillus isosaccharinicus TaxID=1532552 RepID=A0A1S2M0C7_9BACI|nr:YjiH family protein [Anaerobacillus isosaccharinicus]MBA5586550.1 YjiH family protein [Anaerobacillus isosaccharinicus]QOY35211.1 YjiH family protein [Anaerobacillus isosaccharinicus]
MGDLAKQSGKGKGNKFTKEDYLKFIIPSIIGLLLFLVPISYGDSITIPVAFLAKQLNALLGTAIPTITVLILAFSFLGSLIAIVLKPEIILKNEFLNKLLNVSIFWLVARLLGLIFAVMTVYSFGPEWIWSEYTGGLLMYDLIPILLTTFLFAGIFLPLLLNFGLLEFIGALLIKVMRPVFTIPGRSSLDCLASWVGDGTIGVLLTTKQYEAGYYTKREAAVVATTFSVVSITFTIVIIEYLNLGHYFGEYYFTIILAGFVAAIIMPRIPPLSRKPDTSFEGTELKVENIIPKDLTTVQWGLNLAVTKAKTNSKASRFFKEGYQNVIDMWVGVLPIVMAIGTVALVIAEHTSVFAILGKPFEPILMLMQVPEAQAAAQTMVVGFADMFLPAVIGSDIESEMTRFIIACVSVTQLVYMSEIGGLLLGSKLPVKFLDLVFIFLLRTIITLPIIVAVAHIIF